MNNREEQIEQARRLIATGINEDLAMVLFQQFPELKESEDERTRKDLIAFICQFAPEHLKTEYVAYLERQKEQKPVECIEDSVKFKEGFKSGRESGLCDGQKYVLDNLDSYGLCKPAEWSEEDEKTIDEICCNLDYLLHNTICAEQTKVNLENRIKWLIRLKSLRPQPKEEREHMEIKYGGKIYQVHGMRALPGGASGYIIEDEPGHYDCIMNPEEVLGGGYGVKQNGSPYPTKEATFDLPHWKPSEEQMRAVFDASERNDKLGSVLRNLYEDLKKL